LQGFEIASALDAGTDKARALLAAGLIDGAALHLQGETRIIALTQFGAGVSHAASAQGAANAIYA
jgi:hypothetical protein